MNEEEVICGGSLLVPGTVLGPEKRFYFELRAGRSDGGGAVPMGTTMQKISREPPISAAEPAEPTVHHVSARLVIRVPSADALFVPFNEIEVMEMFPNEREATQQQAAEQGTCTCAAEQETRTTEESPQCHSAVSSPSLSPATVVSPLPLEPPTIISPSEPSSAAAAKPGGSTELSASDLAVARRLCADWNQVPSDFPDAQLVCDRPDMKGWKRPLDLHGLDAYETQVELPVRPETFLAMLCDVQHRVQWDSSTKDIRVLRTTGTAVHSAIHKQAGDAMSLFWLVEAPWPLAHREYVLNRKLTTFEGRGDAGGDGDGAVNRAGAGVYIKVDTADDEPASRAMWPKVATKCVRVNDYWNVQVVWAGGCGTCFRSLAREHPMTSLLPKWVMSWLIDKMLPKSLGSLKQTAIEYERRSDAERDGERVVEPVGA